MLRAHQCLVQGEMEVLVMGPPWTSLPVCLDQIPSDAIGSRKGLQWEGPWPPQHGERSPSRLGSDTYLALPRLCTSAAESSEVNASPCQEALAY